MNYKEFKHKWNDRELNCCLYKAYNRYECIVHLKLDGENFKGYANGTDANLLERSIISLEQEISDYCNEEYMIEFEEVHKEILERRRRKYDVASWLKREFIK